MKGIANFQKYFNAVKSKMIFSLKSMWVLRWKTIPETVTDSLIDFAITTVIPQYLLSWRIAICKSKSWERALEILYKYVNKWEDLFDWLYALFPRCLKFFYFLDKKCVYLIKIRRLNDRIHFIDKWFYV